MLLCSILLQFSVLVVCARGWLLVVDAPVLLLVGCLDVCGLLCFVCWVLAGCVVLRGVLVLCSLVSGCLLLIYICLAWVGV